MNASAEFDCCFLDAVDCSVDCFVSSFIVRIRFRECMDLRKLIIRCLSRRHCSLGKQERRLRTR